MILVVQGSKAFDEYAIFLRAMGTAMSSMDPEDNFIGIYSVGPHRINEMAMEFANISERSLKSRGIKIRVFKVPPSWVKENIHDVGYLAYFSKPKEPVSDLVKLGDAKDIEVGVYRY
jgi:hypothetical protein